MKVARNCCETKENWIILSFQTFVLKIWRTNFVWKGTKNCKDLTNLLDKEVENFVDDG